MDDFIVWGHRRQQVAQAADASRTFLSQTLMLTLKEPPQINRSRFGVTVCGYRVLPGTIRLSQSRRKRFRQVKAAWERAWLAGQIDARQLQRGYDAAHAITLHADSRQWRRGLEMNRAEWYGDV